MSTDKILTIVIPAYNSSKYLERCLDSLILDPEYMFLIQVLVVNDGSKDNTSEIAHKYSEKYPESIFVVDKTNGNYGSCMNVGLSMAAGKYFKTLDSDDWYESAGLTRLLKDLQTSDADLVINELKRHFELGNREEVSSFSTNLHLNEDIYATDELLSSPTVRSNYFVASVAFKTDLLRRINMKWPEHVFYSDTYYVLKPLQYVSTVRLLSYPVYVYDIGREGQSVSIKSLQRNFNSLYVVAKLILDGMVSLGSNMKFKTLSCYITKLHLQNCYLHLIIGEKASFSKIKELDKLYSIVDGPGREEIATEQTFYKLPYVRSFQSHGIHVSPIFARVIFKIKSLWRK
uniref:glycosyltransferase family 2 protein n=1 Tax=Prevotella sp. TaxID=59823 RepID=UPI00402A164D